MTSQIPFTPLTPEAVGRLTLDEQLAFEAAACAVAGDQKPSLEVVATLVLTVQRLVTEAPGSTLPVPASGDTGRDLPAAPEQARDRTGADPGDAPGEPHAALIEAAWGLIANSGWDAFSGQADLPKSPGWHEAAIRWRDDYHRWLRLHASPGGWRSWEELSISLCRERDAFFAENERLKRALRDAAGTEPLVMPQDEFGLVKWLQDALAEAIGPAWGHAAVGSALEAVTPVVEHAARAAAGSHEGIRLWMLDCGSLVQKHREHAVEASALLGEQHARASMAEERLAEIATLCRNPAAFVGRTMGAGRVVPGDRMAARILAIIDGEETQP